MGTSLNFSRKDKKQLLNVLKKFPEEKTRTEFEEFRCKVSNCTVTLYNSGKVVVQGKKDEEEKVKELILNNFKAEETFMLGIDEAGRGENFGPLVVAGVLGKSHDLREVRDSKKINNIDEKYALVSKKALGIATMLFSAKEIDKLRNMGRTMNDIQASAINTIVNDFKQLGLKMKIVVDGNPLKGVEEKVEFKPKADDLEPVVGAASVVAKYLRQKAQDKAKRKTWKTKK